jgi:hypothetical protein
VDEQSFDRIARALGANASRRVSLRIAAAAILAATGPAGRRRAAAAQGSPAPQRPPGPMFCRQNDDCLSGELDPCTGAACVDGLCLTFIVDCIPGYVCCGNGQCCPPGEPGVCLSDDDCFQPDGDPCQGVHCEAGTCVPFLVSCAPGFVCCGSGQCCPGHDECAPGSGCPPPPIDLCLDGLLAGDICLSGLR